MEAQTYQLPRIRSILVGVAVFLLFLAILCSLSDLVKLIGGPFLYLPARLGLIREVTSADVYTIHLTSLPTVRKIEAPGRYLVYTGDFQLLSLTTESLDAKAKPWLKLKSRTTGEEVPVSFVNRGLRLYDTPLVKGRPIFAFEIKTAGTYEIIHPRRDATVWIVPDYTAGREKTIVLAYVLQVTAILLVLGFPYYRRSWRRRQAKRARQREKREQVEAFWRAERRRREEEERRGGCLS
ncbi:MAG: hypothetical protein M5U01_12150 [Ardenticatenaceae bacterium]|nr:hypothetical protein [Ardenticatenaceae bacterium]